MSRVDFLPVVKRFADAVLDKGEDVYGAEATPLLADGIHVPTQEPLSWEQEGRRMILSNFASQQILVRTLRGLTALSGEPRYAERAAEIAAFMFERYQQQSGLLPWGTHLFIDLADKNFHDIGKGLHHELHGWFPDFEFLWSVDAKATERLVKGIWDGHIHDWSTLVFNRHAPVHKQVDYAQVWDQPFTDPDPLVPTSGKLTFMDCGSHIIDAGARLYHLNGDTQALNWAQRLNRMYRKARHPKTGLGGYQFTTPRARNELPPMEERFPLDRTHTYSSYGDRAWNVFGEDFGAIAREANLLDRGEVQAVYGVTATALLRLAELLGDAAGSWLDEQAAGLKAYARYGYLPEEHAIRPMWSDGTDLTGYKPKWPGYFQGRLHPTTGAFYHRDVPYQVFFSYCLAYRLTGDPELWPTVRAMARGYGLGELKQPGERPDLAWETDACEPRLLLALLELHAATGMNDYVKLAAVIADRMTASAVHDGLFIAPSGDADFCIVQPFALLRLEAVVRDMQDRLPPFISHEGQVYN